MDKPFLLIHTTKIVFLRVEKKSKYIYCFCCLIYFKLLFWQICIIPQVCYSSYELFARPYYNYFLFAVQIFFTNRRYKPKLHTKFIAEFLQLSYAIPLFLSIIASS